MSWWVCAADLVFECGFGLSCRWFWYLYCLVWFVELVGFVGIFVVSLGLKFGGCYW